MTAQHRFKLIQAYFRNVIRISSLVGSGKDGVLHKYKLSLAQLKILYMIDEHGQFTTSQISQAQCISNPAVTQLVDQLVEAGFLEREQSATDRRVTYLKFTPGGSSKFNKIKHEHLAALEKIMLKLSDQELEQFLQLQLKLLS